jgi:hypothetical protein
MGGKKVNINLAGRGLAGIPGNKIEILTSIHFPIH